MNGISTAFKLALGPILLQIQNLSVPMSIGIKRLEHKFITYLHLAPRLKMHKGRSPKLLLKFPQSHPSIHPSLALQPLWTLAAFSVL
jgi:hypothetical protein